MRHTLQINLASEPFRRDRPFQIAAMAGTAALATLLVIQVSYAWLQHRQATDARVAMLDAQKQLTVLTAEDARLRATLARPDNAAALQYSLFLNDLLRRKGISWTLLFSDLEKVLPYNVRLVDIRPQLTLDNQVQLNMTVASQEPQPVVDLILRLEGSAMFNSPQWTNLQGPSQSEPLYRYRITCNYARKLT